MAAKLSAQQKKECKKRAKEIIEESAKHWDCPQKEIDKQSSYFFAYQEIMEGKKFEMDEKEEVKIECQGCFDKFPEKEIVEEECRECRELIESIENPKKEEISVPDVSATKGATYKQVKFFLALGNSIECSTHAVMKYITIWDMSELIENSKEYGKKYVIK